MIWCILLLEKRDSECDRRERENSVPLVGFFCLIVSLFLIFFWGEGVGAEMYKNQLQELAQRSCFNLPAYTSFREGPDHAPRFKASVNFSGETFESPSYCSTLRQAEHSAAEVALNAHRISTRRSERRRRRWWQTRTRRSPPRNWTKERGERKREEREGGWGGEKDSKIEIEWKN